MKQLPSDDNLEAFRLEIQTEADLLVEQYTRIAVEIMNKVPARVQERLKTFRFDWAALSQFLVTDSITDSTIGTDQ